MTNRIRCLFVMEDHPISPAAPGGGPVVMYSRLELLAHTDLEIHLLLLREPTESFGFDDYVKTQPEIWTQVRSWCASHQIIDLSHVIRDTGSRRYLLRELLLGLRDPTRYYYTNVNDKTIADFRNVVAQVNPHMIWAENLFPAVLAWRSRRDIPLVYGQHDWLWRVLKMNYRWRKIDTWQTDFRFWVLRRIELALVRHVAGCVCASASEAAQIDKINSKHNTYLPITYAPSENPEADAARPARIVHIGGMGTVANRIGLQRFLDVVWPIVCQLLRNPPELWIIGSMKNAPEPLMRGLEQARAKCLGFVQDLGSVLYPYDIHIVPWEHNTGVRTKIPLVFNYAQVVVSTHAAAASLPEVKDGENCVLVNDLEQMGPAIVALVSDKNRRKRIGQSARATFLKHFTRDAVQNSFDQFIGGLPWLSRNSQPLESQRGD